MITISRIYEFSAAHRVENHPQCGGLHGHNYKVTVEIDVDEEEEQQPVLTCFQLDELVRPLIKNLSGKYLISSENISANDPYALIAMDRNEACIVGVSSTTPEHLAEYFVWSLRGLVPGDVVVTVSDTRTSSATFWSAANVRG